ncbi:hypothetical protein NDU88_001179 [Pleurodeles waltl]|uniref:Uncharacterized protein n=1 Tax=Pleurodeles waltl TaxID=8319 RepID=A0AAV7VYP1_PLEWA|nr:hypothetical protein NDU88_001179 [Pleurodeles waltl]
MPRRSPWRLGCQGNTQRMRRQSWKMHAQRLLRTDARAVLAPRKRLTPTAGVLVKLLCHCSLLLLPNTELAHFYAHLCAHFHAPLCGCTASGWVSRDQCSLGLLCLHKPSGQP